MSDSTPQGGGSTPGATQPQYSELNINITSIIATGRANGKTSGEVADELEALIDTAVRTRLLSLPSMQDEQHHIHNADSVTFRIEGRNELRASLRAEVGQSDTERSKT